MEFFINQNSESPLLLMQVVNDGRTNAYQVYNAELDNAVIRFFMKKESTGIIKILGLLHLTPSILMNLNEYI